MGGSGDAEGRPQPGPGGAFLEDLPRLHLEELGRIGSTEDPDYGFSRIGPVQVGPDGNVWVAETQDRELRVYSPDGALLRRVGRRGEGPGEFAQNLTSFGFVGDTVWAWEDWPRRLALFSVEGQVLGTVVVDLVEAELFGPGEWSRVDPGRTDPEGYLVGVRGIGNVAQGPPQRDTAWIPIVRFSLEGQVVDTVGHYEFVRQGLSEPITVGRSRYTVPGPPGSGARLVLTDRDRVRIEHDAGDGVGFVRITRMTHGGDTIRTREWSVHGVPFPEAYLDSLATFRAHQVGPIIASVPGGGIETIERHAEDSAAARAAIRRRMLFPEFQPPVQAHHVAADGALWIRREGLGAPEQRWVVFDAEELPLGVLHVPAGIRIAWSGGEEVWGVVRDALGVPWLVRFRMAAEGG